MTKACGGIKKERHPEERPQGASRRTHEAAPTKLGHYQTMVSQKNEQFVATR